MTNKHEIVWIDEVFTDNGFSCFCGSGGVIVWFEGEIST